MLDSTLSPLHSAPSTTTSSPSPLLSLSPLLPSKRLLHFPSLSPHTSSRWSPPGLSPSPPPSPPMDAPPFSRGPSPPLPPVPTTRTLRPPSSPPHPLPYPLLPLLLPRSITSLTLLSAEVAPPHSSPSPPSPSPAFLARMESTRSYLAHLAHPSSSTPPSPATSTPSFHSIPSPPSSLLPSSPPSSSSPSPPSSPSLTPHLLSRSLPLDGYPEGWELMGSMTLRAWLARPQSCPVGREGELRREGEWARRLLGRGAER